jgi:hypothetical protein
MKAFSWALRTNFISSARLCPQLSRTIWTRHLGMTYSFLLIICLLVLVTSVLDASVLAVFVDQKINLLKRKVFIYLKKRSLEFVFLIF